MFTEFFCTKSYITQYTLEKNLFDELLFKFQIDIIPKICNKLRSYEDLSLKVDILKIYSITSSYTDSYLPLLLEYLTIASQIDKLPKVLPRDLNNIIKSYIVFDEIREAMTIPHSFDKEVSTITIGIQKMGLARERKITVRKLFEMINSSEHLNKVLMFIKHNNLMDDSMIQCQISHH